jgi:hypothetical protein
MTSSLRRKRQTTVRSTHAATEINRHAGCHFSLRALALPAAVFLATCFAAVCGANASDQAFASAKSGIKKVGYSAVTSGSKLKWLPYNEPQADSDKCVVQTAHFQSNPSADDDALGDKNSPSAEVITVPSDEPLLIQSAETSSPSTSPNVRGSVKSSAPRILAAQQKGNESPYKLNESRPQPPRTQTLEEALAAQNPDLREGCLTVKDLKKISQLTTNISPSPGEMPQNCPWGGEPFQPRCWSPVMFTWTASALCHHPLYFEDVQVERYGHALGPWLQPFASATLFYLTLPILPYKMGLELPNECMYTLGYYRPGDCAPYMLDPLPLSVRAGLFEAGAWVGGAAAIP